MRTEGKISKVAICPKCNKFVLACHIDHLTKKTENQFTQFTNEGFDIKLETGEETRNRGYSPYEECKSGECLNNQEIDLELED